MKNFTVLIALAFLFASCSQQAEDTSETPVVSKTPATSILEKVKDKNIYEVNIRQYSKEGTFNAFKEHLPRLKSMGVDILWVMPIQPIGEKNRKGGLGSYYSIQNYTAINPEFGTLEDWNALVEEAHNLDMMVILDWVANHTSWDHVWIDKDDTYYTKDSLGNIVAPVEDWSDVADLNYDNMDMQNNMIADMRYWIKTSNIDGFRCDVAGEVPMTFWNRAKDSLDVDKSVFMLAEWDEPKMHDHAFHMTYGWGFHHEMNELAKGNKDVPDMVAFLNEDFNKFDASAIRMNFTSNHDENSWNGTVKERFGDAREAFAVLAATVQGMPLVYSGMEAGLDKRLLFFEKDTIDFSNLKYEAFYKKLLQLKKDNEALWNGSFGGQPNFFDMGNNKDVIGYHREKNGNEVLVIINFRADSVELNIPSDFHGNIKDEMSGKDIRLNVDTVIGPYQYWVFTKNNKESI